MNILHVAKKYPNAIGGDAVVVANLEQQQRAAGHNVSILTSNCDEIQNGPHIFKFGLKDNPAALDAITPRRLLSLIALFFKAFKVIRTMRPDVIHTHSIDMAWVVSYAARRYRVPIVHTFHIVTFNEPHNTGFRRKSELFLLRHTRPQLVTAPNMSDVEALRGAAKGTRVELLPNGIDLNAWTMDEQKPKGDFTFITTGRLELQKGLEYLVRAAARVAKTRRDFRVVIVGKGSEQPRLEALARELGVADLITFPGAKPPQEVRELYAKAHAFLLPSLWETTPITLLEAWAAKLVAIATPVGILRDLPESEAGTLIVKPQNAKDLADAMLTVMSDAKTRRRLVQTAAATVQQFDWKIIGRGAAELYALAQQRGRRILQVTAYYPPHVGGQEWAVAELGQNLAAAGHDVTVLTSNVGASGSGTTFENGMEVVHFKSLEFAHTALMWNLFFSLLKRARRGDVVHVHVGQAFTPEVVWLASKCKRFSYVMQMHIEPTASGPVGKLLTIYKRLLLRPAVRGASAVIVLNKENAQIVREKYGFTGGVHILNNGIDEAYFAVEHTPVRGKTLQLLTVARFSPQKNLPALVEAMSLASSNVHLNIIGDGEERPKIEAAIRTFKVQKRVTLLGALPRDVTRAQFAASDAFVLPSLYEAQPLVLLEAMATRTPIVGTNVRGVGEHIKGVGYVVEPTPAAIAAGIDAFASDPDGAKTLAAAAFQKAQAFRWSNLLKKYEAVYDEVAQ